MTCHGDRIAIVGASGSGKSTLGRRLALQIGAQHTQLDELFFGPNWEPRPRGAFRADVAKTIASEQWVLDGSYRLVRDLIWSRATTLVWLDYSLPACFSRLLGRTLRRAWTREPVCNGNRESFLMSFASRESILLYLIKSHQRRRDETAGDLAKPEHAHLKVIHLRKPYEAESITLR